MPPAFKPFLPHAPLPSCAFAPGAEAAAARALLPRLCGASALSRRLLRLRLAWEQARLGSDVPSPALCRAAAALRRQDAEDLARGLSIGQWRALMRSAAQSRG